MSVANRDAITRWRTADNDTSEGRIEMQDNDDNTRRGRMISSSLSVSCQLTDRHIYTHTYNLLSMLIDVLH